MKYFVVYKARGTPDRKPNKVIGLVTAKSFVLAAKKIGATAIQTNQTNGWVKINTKEKFAYYFLKELPILRDLNGVFSEDLSVTRV
jgi:hypothetical protein